MPKRERRLYPTQYPTNVTDEQWAIIQPLVTTASPKGGRPPEIDLHAIVNTLIYKNRTGCQWRLLPADFPPMGAIRSYFDKWLTDGTFVRMNDTLRKMARNTLDRDEEPSISIVDAQSTKTTEVGGERGIDGGKKSTGANVNFGLIRMDFCCASLCIRQTFLTPKELSSFCKHIIGLFRGCRRFALMKDIKRGLDIWMEKNTSVRLNVIAKPVGQKGFAVIPKRWVVERSIAWAGRNRLASKAYNRNAVSSESFIYLGSIALLLNRLHPKE